MDKIYSRKRIIIPKLHWKKEKKERKHSFFPIILIASLMVYVLLKAIDPMFEESCAKEALSSATEIVTKEAGIALQGYEYKDLVIITKEEKTNILQTNVSVINNIATDITNRIAISLKELEKKDICIPLGALSGSKWLAASGPDIKVKIMPVGTVTSEIKTEFKEQGINQTIYKIYLDINCEIKILMPYKTINRTIQNKVLLLETAIIGDIPETYYNLENFTKDDTIKLID